MNQTPKTGRLGTKIVTSGTTLKRTVKKNKGGVNATSGKGSGMSANDVRMH